MINLDGSYPVRFKHKTKSRNVTLLRVRVILKKEKLKLVVADQLTLPVFLIYLQSLYTFGVITKVFK